MSSQALLSVHAVGAARMLSGMRTKGERIRHLRDVVLNMTQQQFAARIGNVTRGAVGNWERNKGIKTENLVQIAEMAGSVGYFVSVDWLATGDGDPPEEGMQHWARQRAAKEQPDQLPAMRNGLRSGIVEFDDTEFVAIGRYDARLSAGPGAVLQSNAEPLGYAIYEAQWLRSITRTAPDSLMLVQVDGDSMEPTLSNRDWVLIDRSQTRMAEGIFALVIGDSIWVKRVSLNLREKLVRIISDNERYPIQELPEDEVMIFGRVVWIVGRRV